MNHAVLTTFTLIKVVVIILSLIRAGKKWYKWTQNKETVYSRAAILTVIVMLTIIIGLSLVEFAIAEYLHSNL